MRSTRSGTIFSPYEPAPIYCAKGFDFAPLLQESTRWESDDLEDGDPDNAASQSKESGSDREASPSAGSPPLEWPRPPTEEQSPRPQTTTAANQEPACTTSRPHSIRRNKRAKRKAEEGHVPRAKTYTRYVEPSVPIETPITSESLPAAKGGYSALNAKQKSGDKKAWAVNELIAEGFRYLNCPASESRPLLDDNGTVLAALVGQPPDPSFRRAARRAFETLMREGQAAGFRREEMSSRRGQFAALNVGVTYGNRTTQPVTLNDHEHADMVSRLLADADFQRLASFASAGFQLWAPNVYRYYKDHLDPLWARMPELRRNFPRSIFPSAAFNFGPNVWTYRHRDSLNCPFGWCAIQALGDFDPTRGGHLILWELRLVIEFPPGSLVLIPSATISHSNVPVQGGDTRASFTQYCAGGLFRYVDNGFRTEKEFEKEDVAGFRQMCKLKETRWTMGLGLLSKFDDIVKSSCKATTP
ncbi:hypothetical protein Hypma_012874 [Hypsizygus marmoreus]|uniref:Uncharacterized protein n=1 Tax=Hypsizygus marmoreus TaxID=39966 RepID=A0A369JK90_HYPMA|nr:hypothetical protein Hypma_012874 [Hypsizygus marmoreus]